MMLIWVRMVLDPDDDDDLSAFSVLLLLLLIPSIFRNFPTFLRVNLDIFLICMLISNLFFYIVLLALLHKPVLKP